MAAGVVVPMMCGVEHDHVINTLEKLCAIPGFKPHLTNEHFALQLAKINGAICTQNADLALGLLGQQLFHLRGRRFGQRQQGSLGRRHGRAW